MNATNRKWLKRLGAERREADAWEVEYRQGRRILVSICSEIRGMLTELGVDPEQCRSLRHGDEAAAELAAIPDTPELQRADEEFEAGGGEGEQAAEEDRQYL